ncbi:hypothetical protein [Myroides odoratus]|uniref:hypothetical protein n=1 Tax=Myroides odoratus TaxID=256 RepID=UPI000765BFC4|nr:hypothetical protein [Myroides odoratus]
MTETELENIIKNPCWVAFLHPFTFVVPDDENPWEVKLEEINNVSYSSGNLIRIVTKIDIPNCELPALICYDGAIAIPRNENFPSKESALNFFCDLFVKLLFAGFNIEGIDHKDIVTGNLHEKWAIWPTNLGESSISQTHSKIRMLVASNMDTIQLSNPRIVRVKELKEKLISGNLILQKIPNLTPKFLLRGITEFRYKNWDLVLSNLWITVEQIIDYLWHYKFLSNAIFHPFEDIPNRKKSMKDDSRTWTASIKQEILFQSKILTEDILKNLSEARKARNKLVHEGKAVDQEIATSILKTTFKLIQIISNDVNFDFLVKKENQFEIKKNKNLKIDFDDWKCLPESKIIENVFGDEITQKVKK